MLIRRITLVAAGAMTLSGMAALSVPAFAQGSLQDQLAVCARISKNSARIECYDSIAGAASGQSSSSSSFGASSIRTPSAPATVTGAAMGAAAVGTVQGSAPAASSAAAINADQVDVAVVSSRDNGLAMWQFALADGAVWRMTERDTSFRPPAPNETVTIRKGTMGSYLMNVGKQASVRVERIR